MGRCRSVPVSPDGLEAALNPFSALFDNLSLRRLAGVTLSARCQNPDLERS
jgi:hypothetical protein